MKKVYLQIFANCKQKSITFLAIFCSVVFFTNSVSSQSLANGGFEANTVYPGAGWTGSGYMTAGTIATTGSRTGTNNLTTTFNNFQGYDSYITNSNTVSVASNNYLHVIAWAKVSTASTNTIIWFSATNTNQSPGATLTTTFAQYSGNFKNTGNANTGLQPPPLASPQIGFNTSGSTNRTFNLDDVVAYTDANGTSDLVSPGGASSFTNGTITSSSANFTWTNGTDAIAPITNVQGVVILRTTNTGAAAPSLNNQGIYSVAGGVSGPKIDQTGNWTIINIGAATNGSAGSYTDNTVVAGTTYKYAVINYDLAYNYSISLVSNNLIIPAAASITTSAIIGSPFCITASAGSSVSVPFTSVGTFSGNTYTAQLSSATGSFTTPTAIGSLISNANLGTISATIPANTATGSGYRIRVVSSAPVVTGADNGSNLIINLAANSISPATAQTMNTGVNGNVLTVTEQSTPSSRTWYYSTTSGGPYTTSTGVTTTTYTPNFATPGTYYVVCVSTFACNTAISNPVQIIVTPSYKAQFVSMSTGATTWCAGEVRTISVTVKNIGTATWTSGGSGVNFSYYWSNQIRDFNPRILPFAGLAPNQQQTITFQATATSAGTFTLNFDLVLEGLCWFGDNTINCSGPSNAVFVSPSQTIAALPQGSLSGSTICSGNPGQLTFTASAGTGPFTVVYNDGTANQTATNVTSGTAFNVVTNPASNTTYTLISVTNSAASGGCVTTTGFTGSSAIINVSTSPSISTQPVSQIKCTGNSVTFSVTASGTSPTYQWRKNGANISGATSSSYTIASVAAADAANYDVVVTVASCGSITSSVATLTVNTPAAITTQPASQTVCASSPVTFSVAASGTPAPTYQWSKGGSPISGATFSSYTIASASAADAATYTVVVTNSCGTVTSNNAVLNVNTAASISTQPVSQTKCTGNSVTFSLTASGSSPTYQWRKNGVNISGATSSSYSIASVAVADAANYDAVVTVASCGSITSSVATLTVNAAASITAQPTASQTVCNASPVTFSVTASGTPAPTYQWNKSGSPISGATSSSYTIASASAADAGIYTVVVTNSCGTVTSTNAVLNVTATGSWIGITSTDWNTASNWCGGIPTATSDVTIPAVGSVPFQPIIGAADGICRSITLNGTLGITGANTLDVYGDFTNNGTFTANTSSVTFRGGSGNVLAGSSTTTFYNLIVNKAATANTITSTTKAFAATNLTVSQGDLILTAIDASYFVSGNITVPAAGILTDNVNWDGIHFLSVGGNIAIDGIFNYTTGTPHVNMNGGGTVAKTVRTGTNPASAFGFLTLSTGDYLASGTLVVNSNFWTMFGTSGTFSTNGQTITANAAILIDGGSLNINGGTLNVTGGINDGYAGLNGVVNFTSGVLNADFINVGDGTRTGVFNHSGGTANVTGNILINPGCSYVSSVSPIINIAGTWTNNGTFTGTGSQINFNGSAAQTITGTSFTTFNNLSIANAAGITLATTTTGSTNVNNILNLSNGLVTTGANVITVAAAGSIMGASSSSYINGKLAQIFSGTGSKTFPTGKGGNYRPLTFNFTALSAATTITVEQQEATLPGAMNPATVTLFPARYWDITKSNTGNTFTYFVTLDGTGFTPSGLVKIVKQESGANSSYATTGSAPNYTNAAPGFTTFAGTTSGKNSFALGADCSSTANAGAALTAICQGGTSAPLGGSVSGTATGGTWTDGGVGGTFTPNATTLNATWTPPAAFTGTATLTLTPTGGICPPNTPASKLQVVNTPPSISGQPVNQITCAGTAKNFTVTAAGTSLTYQWQYLNGATWSNVVNGTPSNIAYANATTATLTVTPSAAAISGLYYYRCIVSVPSCTVLNSASATLTVNISSTLSLSAAAGTDAQTVCTNTSITNITYAIGGGGTGATVTGLPPGTIGNYAAGVFTISGAPSVPGNYNYTVTTTGPCFNPSLSGTIGATAIPTGTFKATENSGTPNDGNICAGSSVTFTLTPSGYGSYIFKVNGSIVQNGTSNIYSSSTLTNGASVTVDVANSLNCGTTFGPIVINVAPAPVASLVASKTSICPGDNVTFTAGATGNNYNFKVNGSSIQSGTSNTYSTTTLTNGNSVTVDVTNINGCTATSAAQVITVNTLPTGTLTPLTTTICSGTNVTFTASGSYSTYEFKINGVSVQGPLASNTYSTNTLTNGQVVTVIATNGSGCSAPFNSVVATVNALPAGTFTASENSGIANDSSICPGAPVTFAFNSGYSNYNFKVNGVTVQNGTSNSYINTTLNPGDIVTVLVSSNTGCNASFTAPAITVVSAPSGSLSFSPASICSGDNVTFTADAGFANYNFQVNGASVQNGASNTYSSISFVNGDVVTVNVTNSNGCVTTFNAVTLTVHALATGTLIPVENSGNTANDGIICTGAPVVFTAPGGYTNYDFLLNGATIQSGTSNIYNNNTLANGDQVQVAITNTNGCIGLLNTDTITVNTLPAVSPITGTVTMCLNGTSSLSDATTGGVWTSANPSIATIDPSTGLVTGVAAGSAIINYTFTNTNGCSTVASTTVTVNAPPVVSAISGNVNVCTGSTSQLSDATAGGLWASSNPSIATVDASGLVNGVSVGNSIISYTVTVNGCTTTVTASVTISDFPVVASINPSSPNVCIGSTTSLTDATAGGTWSSNNTAVATINASGVVTGLAGGTSVIDYTVNTTCGQTVKVSVTVTVSAPPSATIAYTGSPFCTSSGPITVIQTGTPGGTYASASGLIINGSTGTITPATSAAGSYTVTYSIPASGGCGLYTTTANVVITAAPSATISYSGPYCTSAAPVSVSRTGTPGGIYSSTSGLTIDGATGTITPATSTNGTYTVTYTIAASGGCAQFVTTAPVTITTAPSATISYAGTPFCTSAAAVNVTLIGTTGGTYSATPAGLSINTSTGTITPASSAAGSYLVTYTITSSGGCATYTTTTTVNITAAPTAVAGTAVLTCANSGAVNITAGSSATNQSSVLWTSSGTAGTIANANSLSTASYTPSTADKAAGSVTLTLTATGNAPCGLATSTKVVTISAPPVAPTITPSSATICQNSVQPLSAGTSPTSGGPSFASVTLYNNQAIPDYSLTGVVSPVAVSGIPAGAVINSVSVKFNITHTYDGDLVINLKAPNNNVLNLVDLKAGGANFTNTIVSSLGGSIFTNGTGAPFTGTYSADADYPVPSGAGNTPNVTAFASLFGTPNGSWTLSVFDLGSGDVGTLNNWTITINYTVAATPQPVTWSPITDLYTDAGGTIAYAGQSLATVYTKPATSGSKTYTALTTGATCTNSSSVTLTVNPAPAVSITADYCSVAGKVHLTATSVPAAASYTWNTGATTQSIDVDIAAVYKVTASLGSGCPGTATISVAQELVVNGDFTNGNTGFTSDYNYKADVPGLVPAGQGELYDDSGNNGYSISTNGQNVHVDFWGRDHTNNATGNRNYMLVNGHGNTLVVWKETVNVLPNTTYYFSAWAMSLNNAGNNAQLKFSVNGVLVGTTATLGAGVENNNNGQPGSGNVWTRFYGSWTSGPAVTSASIYINDLQGALGGNDFGIDDVSFGTLSTFVSLNSAPGTDAQTLCVNNAIIPIGYSVGSSSTAPTVTGLPAGVTATFNGVLLTISGTPTVAGNFAYTVTTTGTCNPSSASGTINVQSQTITLTSASGTPVCINSSLPNIIYTLGGTATGASATGLPSGVTGTVTAGNTFTINGIPTVAGVFNYTVTTSGTCTPVTITGTITVQSQTIALNSANNTQTICINAPVSNIQYTIGGTGTGASVSGLPPGVSGNYNSGLFIISGTPTSAAGSPYTYTVTTTGTCSPVTATGIITVTPAASLSLTSASGTNAQVVCKGNAITDITYSVSNGTNASATGLPAGVNGSYNAGVFTISGTPTSATGNFNYIITATGGCASGTISGTITVQVQTITLTSGAVSPSVCLNTPMSNIVYTIGGTATSATASGLPAGISGSLSGNAFTISGAATGPAGAYAYKVTTSGSCGQVIDSGTITVQPAAVGGTLTSIVSVCSGGSGSLSLLGQSGTIIRWESSTNGGSSWTAISNTTISESYTNITKATLYRAVVNNGCGIVYSSVALVGVHNLWTGSVSTDWNVAGNWSDNLVPSMSCPLVYIPNTPNQPVLSNGTGAINNLQIFANASLTINGTGYLKVAGTITNSGSFDVSNGSLELNGTSQSVSGSMFTTRAIKNLIVSSGGSGLSVSNTAGDTLNILGSLSFGSATSNLNTGGNITFKSTQAATASIGVLAAGNVITGDVTVERYIGTGTGSAPNHAKSWQLLAIPTQGQTIKQAWQEGAAASDIAFPAAGSAGNPHTGYGTMITSAITTATSLGFDGYTAPGASMKVFNSVTNGYDGPVSASLPIYNQKGYFVFVRGDRSISVYNQAAIPTILRTKGTLFTPANPPVSTNVANNSFESVGNPYASALDMRNITRSAHVNATFQVWDPRLGGGYNYGAFQTFIINPATGDYEVTPGLGSYGAPGSVQNFIQSGQAFIVQTSGGTGTVSFTENAKVSGSALFSRPASASQVQSLRTGLYNGSGTELIDGVLNQFDDSYVNAVDGLDAKKSGNTGENLSIKTAATLLVVERKHTISAQDTIFLNLTGEKAQPYQFQFTADNIKAPGIDAFLEDNYLHTRTPVSLSGSTVVNFTIVNIAGSYAPDRFRIVFKSSVVLPVTFTSVKAYQEDKNINVEWRVENEVNIKQYEVEKSINGTVFTTMDVKTASANGGRSAIYVTTDITPVTGYNYYRVKSVDMDGKTVYTNIVKVLIGTIRQDITIYPNPITDGSIHLQLLNQPEGKYGLRLVNKIGQIIVSRQINHAEGNSTELIKWDFNLAHGLYNLEVTKPDGSVKNINVLY